MMNRNHLPAGQGMPPDMTRRRPFQNHHGHAHAHVQSQYHYYPPGATMYNGGMQAYVPGFYPQQYPPQYHNPAMHQPYSSYQTYGRSPPPALPPYVHAPVPQHPQSHPRAQQSPALVTSYQPPPPQTPTSTQSSQTAPGPMTPPTPQAKSISVPSSSPPDEVPKLPFRPPLPWLSRPDLPWPSRKPRRKKRQHSPDLSEGSVELPITQASTQVANALGEISLDSQTDGTGPRLTPGDADSTNSTTPLSKQTPVMTTALQTSPQTPKASLRPKPVVPIIPAVPKFTPRPHTSSSRNIDAEASTSDKTVVDCTPEASESMNHVTDQPVEVERKNPTPPPVKAWTAPKSWTGLFSQPAAAHKPFSNMVEAAATTNSSSTAETLAETLRVFSAEARDTRLDFLEPKGLVNSGNMCYMNSVLQVLIFCPPFYKFLNLVSKRAAHSFKSETPLIDAMIMFMREYKVIHSAQSTDQLRIRLKDGELDQFGESFTPDFVYDVMRRLPRFVTMQRGHQQDAEEFLGFLLEGLHDECVHIMRASVSNGTSTVPTPTDGALTPSSDVAAPSGLALENGDWHQVGPKQKASVTRSSGTITTSSPVTKIFGGSLRSELRVPGLKDSVTLEPYQPLQLDIGAPHVNNIVDALKSLTRSEPLHGDFKSPKGPNVVAMKQVLIESVPPVLILHLKRFQYNNAGGTQKIWKRVGYPLELELPKEVFPRSKRAIYAHDGFPRYQLIAAVYHHGKNASGGHYTVDVRRQDGREWIRLDDTLIRRIGSQEVAEAGREEDPKVLAAAAAELYQKDGPVARNPSSSVENQDPVLADEDGWKQATGSGKKWSSVVNGASTPKAKNEKFSLMDNKVAYLLFYQRI